VEVVSVPIRPNERTGGRSCELDHERTSAGACPRLVAIYQAEPGNRAARLVVTSWHTHSSTERPVV
jgi:hypothetical protein